LRASRRNALILAQLIAAALLLYFVGRQVVDQWTAFRRQPLDARLDVVDLLVSGAIVFATYAMLLQVWRMLIAGSGARLTFWKAVRIWAVSGLWRYVPGKVWAIGALSALAHRENVPAVVAAGASILSTVINIATGLAITLALIWRFVGVWSPSAQPVALLLIGLTAIGLIALPYVLPRLAAIATRMTGKGSDLLVQPPPKWSLGLAIAANVLSWVLYGIAFRWLVSAVLGDAAGATWQYIAVFTASYVVGYLFLIAPGGIGPREAVMFSLMTSLGLATAKEAALVTVASRIWLTILEIVPGVLFLAHDAIRRRPSTRLPTDAPRE
jgi:glycosyltransferase 2 family protein